MSNDNVVWFCEASGDNQHLVIMVSTDIRELSDDIAVNSIKRHKRGETVPIDELPRNFYGDYSDKKVGKIPHLFKSNGFWCVSAAFAAVLTQFDLGTGGVVPIHIFENDHITPVKGDYFLLNLGCKKSAYLPLFTINARRNGFVADRWEFPGVIKDGRIALSPAALEGPDLWVDSNSPWGELFFSARLAKALKAAKLDRAFSLFSCRVVNEDGTERA